MPKGLPYSVHTAIDPHGMTGLPTGKGGSAATRGRKHCKVMWFSDQLLFKNCIQHHPAGEPKYACMCNEKYWRAMNHRWWDHWRIQHPRVCQAFLTLISRFGWDTVDTLRDSAAYTPRFGGFQKLQLSGLPGVQLTLAWDSVVWVIHCYQECQHTANVWMTDYSTIIIHTCSVNHTVPLAWLPLIQRTTAKHFNQCQEQCRPRRPKARDQLLPSWRMKTWRNTDD